MKAKMRIHWQEANSEKNKHSVTLRVRNSETICNLLRHAVWLEIRYPEDEGTGIFRNVNKYFPFDKG